VRVSAKSDYALRALIELARGVGDGDGDGDGDGATRRPMSAEELGRLQDIPAGFLQTILADLRRAGIVASQRGQSGGWRLARPAEAVSVADVIRAVDGPLVSVHGDRPEAVAYNEAAEALQLVWIAARSSLRDVCEQVTLRSLADRELPAEVAARTHDDEAWQPH
jgi:Rrf2 family protein